VSGIRAVLLDAAGTLLRPREAIGATYSRFAAAHGVELPAWRLDDAFRRVLRAAPPMAFPDQPSDRVDALERAWWRERVRDTFRAADQTARFGDFDAFFSALFAHYARAEAWVLLPGAREGLEALRRSGRQVAVLSNFDRRLRGLLAGLGVRVDRVLLPAELGAAKPDLRCFERALAELGVAAAEAVYVGDDPDQDLAAAARAGMRAIDATSLATLGELPERIAALEAVGEGRSA
jgi:putative hydrolase of the HAD superfamily